MTHPSLRSKILGCLLGAFIGDAIGALGEAMTFDQIREAYGELSGFVGMGTDDTAIRHILIDAIGASGGHPRIDDVAAAFLRARDLSYDLWWVPVKNMVHKLELGAALPVDAGLGNMPSSSSAMAIAPMGILNAGDPARASRETFEIASLIHSGPAAFGRDAACAMAAAVAAAMSPGATVTEVIAASTAYLLPTSSAIMREAITSTLTLAEESGGYERFRAVFYETELRAIVADPRETVPVALALVALAGGDPNRAILMGANFGRDADTIATMAGGLAGALAGVEALRPEWVHKAGERTDRYADVVELFVALLIRRRDEARVHAEVLGRLLEGEESGECPAAETE